MGKKAKNEKKRTIASVGRLPRAFPSVSVDAQGSTKPQHAASQQASMWAGEDATGKYWQKTWCECTFADQYTQQR